MGREGKGKEGLGRAVKEAKYVVNYEGRNGDEETVKEAEYGFNVEDRKEE
jgi:hypothetical protein